jgi:hypothetical protein
MFSYNVSPLFEWGAGKGGGGGVGTIEEKFILFFLFGTGPVVMLVR